MMELKNVVIDVDGSEAVSKVIVELLNTFPGLRENRILFSTLSTSSGIGFFPTSGAVLLSDKESITGHVKQVCSYPFDIVYRAAPKTEGQKIKIKEFLDLIGRWLERQSVVIGDNTYQLIEYPDLSLGNRKIKQISRTNSGHLGAAYNDGVEDWIISAELKYENEFDR